MTEQEKQSDFSDGYIKLYRKFKENIFYKNSEAVHLWLHLLFSASFEDSIFYYKNTKIERKKGQLITGRKKLSQETGIGESTVFRLLKLFESEHQIEQQKTNKYTIITILSYDKYNGNEQQIEQQKNNKRTTDEQQKNTSKELRELRKLKEINKEKKSYGEFDNVLLTDEQYEKLKEIYNQYLQEAIETLSSYIKSSGKKYKEHYAVLGRHNWVYKKITKENEQKQEAKSPYRIA